MRVRPGIRASVIILFLGLYLTSLIIINGFFLSKQRNTTDAIKNLKFDESFSSLNFETKEDTILAKNLMQDFRQTLAVTEMLRNEAQVYSAVLLFALMIISIIIFIIIFYKITRPLKELQAATSRIREGDFSVNLPENGIREIKDLKQSFNSMSRELDNVQKKLLEAEKAVIWKEFSRILAHEIKNPLTPIQLSIQRLEDKFETRRFNEIFPEAVQIINQEIDNLRRLATTFSNFAKKINPKFTKFNVHKSVENIIHPYEHKYKITLSGEKDCITEFDQVHFYQIITNILQNAIDVSPPDEMIRITIIKADKNILVEIKDSGIGISKEDLTRIFEPYFSKKKKGIGLGLALVRKLADLNNAEILVKSELKIGSSFTLKCPCLAESYKQSIES